MADSFTVDHPVTEPNLPSFIHPELAEVQEDLEMVNDCWELLKGAKKSTYVPAEEAEPTPAYKARLMRSSYSSFFRDAIVAYAGALSRLETNKLPPLMEQSRADLDLQGNSLEAVGAMADALALRDGGCLMVVDMTADRPKRRGVEIAKGRRPWVSLYPRAALRNWRTEVRDGVEVPVQLTLLEFAQVSAGDYGIEFEARYRVFKDNTWMVVVVKQSKEEGGKYAVELADLPVPEGAFEAGRGKTISSPPVVWYSASREGFGRGALPLKALADLSLDHLREYSDLKELLHRTALITPVREGVLNTGPPDANGNPTTPRMILGPNRGIDLPMGGKFYFAEVEGGSLDKHQAHLEHIEKLIDRQTLSFLFQGGNPTATQANLETAQLQATLASVSENKQAAWRRVMELWTQFSGEDLDQGAGIRVKTGVFDKDPGPEEVRLVRDLYNDGLLSKQSALWLIDHAGMLPPDVNPEDELKRIADEEPPPGKVPGLGDLADGLIPPRPPGRPQEDDEGEGDD